MPQLIATGQQVYVGVKVTNALVPSLCPRSSLTVTVVLSVIVVPVWSATAFACSVKFAAVALVEKTIETNLQGEAMALGIGNRCVSQSRH